MTPPVFKLYGRKHKSLCFHDIDFDSKPYEMVEKVDNVSEGQSIFLMIIRTADQRTKNNSQEKLY